MMRFPYPFYLRQQSNHQSNAEREAEASNWALAWICLAFWGAILALALLFTL